MSPQILTGRIVREQRIPDLIQQVKKLSYTPTLAIIQVGHRPDSTVYIRAKQAFAQKIGVATELIHLHENISRAELVDVIQTCNANNSIQGIIVQLPLPEHIERDEIIETINPSKDTDGLTHANQTKLLHNDADAVIPATARGVKELFAYYGVELKGKKVAVVGRSRLVGTPIALICKHAGAEVIVCHSKTPDIARETIQADVIIVAVGKPGLIGADYLKKGAVVIDVGITKMPDGSLKGDVDADAVRDRVSAITPIPGGVGPMTVLALFENLVDACK